MVSLRLVIMSRAPVAGETKTRLIPAIGAEGSARFHAACLADLLDEAEVWRSELASQCAPLGVTLSITPAGSEAAFRAAGVALSPGVTVSPQPNGSLGERMAVALHDGLADAELVLLTGCDLPLLTRWHWHAAAQALANCDSVFGPAADGGYYLIGVRRDAPEERWRNLLDLGEWGNGTVLQRTLARAEALGLRTAQIATLPDADMPEDLQLVLAHPLAARLATRRSLAFLRDTLPTAAPAGP